MRAYTRAHQERLDLIGGIAFHVPSGQPLVREHDHPGAQHLGLTGVGMQLLRDPAFAEFRVGQTQGHRHALGRDGGLDPLVVSDLVGQVREQVSRSAVTSDHRYPPLSPHDPQDTQNTIN